VGDEDCLGTISEAEASAGRTGEGTTGAGEEAEITGVEVDVELLRPFRYLNSRITANLLCRCLALKMHLSKLTSY